LSRVAASAGALVFLFMNMPRTLNIHVTSRAPAWEHPKSHLTNQFVVLSPGF
jgi:hypothetical protein